MENHNVWWENPLTISMAMFNSNFLGHGYQSEHWPVGHECLDVYTCIYGVVRFPPKTLLGTLVSKPRWTIQCRFVSLAIKSSGFPIKKTWWFSRAMLNSVYCDILWYWINGRSSGSDPMEVLRLYLFFRPYSVGIFPHRPKNRPNIYCRNLQFRFLKWPLIP